jgi:hypothetical protein
MFSVQPALLPRAGHTGESEMSTRLAALEASVPLAVRASAIVLASVLFAFVALPALTLGAAVVA